MSSRAAQLGVIPATGLTVVVPHEHPALDIVFVHGFTGHPERTWSHKRGDPVQSHDDDNGDSEPKSKSRRFAPFSAAHKTNDHAHSSVYWPRDLLPSTIPNARVLTYGYDTHIRHWVGQPVSRNTVRDIAWDCLVALEAHRRENPGRPLLFVVHSLGGIVVKEILRRSSGCCEGQSHLRLIFDSTIGIIFFGTPHGGSDPRGLLQHVAQLVIKAMGFRVNEDIVNTLLPSSERLRELRDEFSPIAHQQRWSIHSFQEQLPVKTLGKVVEDASSYLNFPAIEITEHIGRNHMDMCRFTGPNDTEYQKVAAALRRLTAKLPSRHEAQPQMSLTKEQRQQLLDSLRFDQIDARHLTIKSAHRSTCKWLKKKDEFVDWLDPHKLAQHHGFLWVKGKPGTGKSTLMKFALDQARRFMKDKITISFFFNARGETLEKSTTGMFRSLLLQLLERIPDLDAIFESLQLTVWPRHGLLEWTIESLKSIFEKAVQSLGQSQVVCFIDALDECDEDEIRDMIGFFEHIGESIVASNIRFQVMFSSRHYPHITIARGRELILEGQEGHEQDLASYIDSELKIGHSQVAKDIKAELQDKSSGIFMWVVLVVGMLNKAHDGGRIHALRKRLHDIPAGLHELFRDILTRDTRDRAELILCIQWVLYAKTRLKPEEFYYAILAGMDPECLDHWDQDLVTPTIIQRFITDASKGLVETTSTKSPVVQFIHESVRDFLLKEDGLRKIWPDLKSNFRGQSHDQLKKCCLAYISKNLWPTNGPPRYKKDLERARETLPFLSYSVHNIFHHADEAQGNGVDQAVFLRDFPLNDWTEKHNVHEKFSTRRHLTTPRLLYILAEHDTPHLIKTQPSRSSPLLPGLERYDNPFSAALAMGSTKAVLAFSEFQAYENIGTRFQKLCQRYLENPELIPKLGRDLDSSSLASSSFVKEDNVEKARLFLALGKLKLNLLLPVESGRGTISGTLLWHAAEKGCASFAKFLIDSGASIDLVGPRDQSTGTPLFRASKRGHEVIARMLLDNGAAVDEKDKDGSTPLMEAIRGSHNAIVELLLNRGAEIRWYTDKAGNSSLGWAAEQGFERIVARLLQIGADIAYTDTKGNTPLHYAAFAGHEPVVSLLLRNRAPVDSKNVFGQTPLMLSAKDGHQSAAKLLLEHGARVDEKDSMDRTPLMIAVENQQCASIVKMLLEYGAHVNAKSKMGHTPLSYTIGMGVWGATVDSTHQWHASPLGPAGDGYEAIVKALIDRGADVTGLEGEQALIKAIGEGHSEIVQVLLEKKVSVRPKFVASENPLFLAVKSGHESIVKMLLAAGADVLEKDHEGNSPLSLALKERDPVMVKLLGQELLVQPSQRDDSKAL